MPLISTILKYIKHDITQIMSIYQMFYLHMRFVDQVLDKDSTYNAYKTSLHTKKLDVTFAHALNINGNKFITKFWFTNIFTARYQEISRKPAQNVL